MSDNILQVNDLWVEYTTSKSTVKAVNGISFGLERGGALGFVGETGAGKTTTALSIMRLVPNPPGKITGGEILFEGENLLNMSANDMRRVRGKKISMIFQDPMTSLNPVTTVGKQIAEVIRLHEKVNRLEATEKAVHMLETVGIQGNRYDDYPHQFSGGMKQRVGIAMALACNPSLIIADEPTTALDVTIQAQVLELIENLQKEFGTSLLLITHDLGVVAEVCEKAMIVYAGEIVEFGTLDQIYNHTKHPYTVGLFESLPNFNEDVERLKPIKGLMPDPSNLPVGCNFAPRCPFATDLCRAGEIRTVETEPGHMVRCTRFY